MRSTHDRTTSGAAADPAEPPKESTSSRTEIVPFSNALLYLAFCLLAGTGLALEFRLNYRNAKMLGVLRPEWVEFHRLVALTFLSLSVIHVWVNLPWLRVTLARLRWPTLVVVMVGLAVLGAFLFAPVF